ncbi:MAG: hypothetical protein ACXV39_11345 [Halobacteriota archaeon]
MAKQVIIIGSFFMHRTKNKNLSHCPPQPFPMPFVHQPEYIPGIPAATITTPTNNSRVENSVFVKGTAQNIGGEYSLWLTLYDYNASRHYPQDGPVAISSNGEWEMTVSFESSGRYDITALAADKNAHETLLLYRAASESSGDYPGLSALPSGCITLASVTVSRT